MTRRKFTKEFKLMVLSELEAGKTAAQVNGEHSIEPTLVFRWKHEHSKYPDTAFQGRGRAYTNEAAIAEKDRLIGRLYAENELLKKPIRACCAHWQSGEREEGSYNVQGNHG